MNDPRASEPVQAWLQRARSDLALGRAALTTPGVLREDACFHAQQCVEKALKALLIHHNTTFPRTHVIGIPFDLLKAISLSVPEAIDEAFVLSQ